MHERKNADSIIRLAKMRCGGNALIRLNMIRNYPVICENKRIGLLLGMRFDFNAKRASDLVISCGFRGKRMIHCDFVESIADGFILVKNSYSNALAQNYAETAFAFDTTGLLVGRVMDVAVDESSMAIQALEIATGYLPGVYTKRIWIFEYECKGCSEMIIPASVGSGLMELIKEEKTCV